VKVASPDYKDMDKEKAVEDFKLRIQHYKEVYEPIDDKIDRDLSFIKIYNQGEKFLVNRVKGECFLRPILKSFINHHQ
jgi:hypothetical protein